MKKQYLTEQIVDAIVAFKFLKLMTQDFKDTDAFKLGIVDKDGKILKKRKDLKMGAEKSAYTIFHTLVWNIKKLLKKVPFVKSKLGSYVASLFLLKEAVDTLGDPDEDYELGKPPSFEDTLDLVKEQQEEELEMDDDTFEL